MNLYFYNIHTFIQLHLYKYIYPSPFAEVSLKLLTACKLGWRAENRTRALQQADAIPTELRRTRNKDI